MLRSSAGSMDRSIERSKSSRSVDRQVNMIVSGVETLMNQYEYYLAQRTVVAKALEIARTAQAIQQTMQAQVLAVDADVLSAAAQLSSAKSQLESIDAGIDQIYRHSAITPDGRKARILSLVRYPQPTHRLSEPWIWQLTRKPR